MKNLLFIVYNYSGYSGATKQANLLRKYLKKYNIKILSIENHENKNIVNHKDDIYYAYSGIQAIYLLIKNCNASLFLFFGYFPRLIFISILLFKNIIVKTTLIGEDDFETLLKKNKIIRSAILRKINLNIVQNMTIYNINNKYKKKIKIIGNGVEIEDNCRISKDMSTFIAVGVVCERKDTINIIQYYINNYENENNKLLIIGPYNGKESKEINKLYVEKCFEISNNHNIQFLGNIEQNELKYYYSIASVIFHFSKKEGMPNVVLEAMAYGCIPIVKNMDGVSREILLDLSDQLIIDEENKKIVSYEEIIKIIENYKIKTIIDNYNIKKVAKIYEEVIDEIINRKKENEKCTRL